MPERLQAQFLLADFGVLKVSGADSRDLLNNLLSNNIAALAAGDACFATLNTPQGRVIANFIVCALEPTEFLLLVKKELLPGLINKLTLYRLRSDVVLKADSSYSVRGAVLPEVTITLPLALKFPFIRENKTLVIPSPVGTVFFLAAREQSREGLNPDPDGWEDFNIKQGFTWVNGRTSGLFVAQMLNMEVLGAVNFKKGCYPGQEVIARAQYRGQVKKRPMLLAGEVMPPAGTVLLDADDEEVGIVTAAAHNTAGGIDILAVAKLNLAAPVYTVINNKPLKLRLVKIFYEPQPQK